MSCGATRANVWYLRGAVLGRAADDQRRARFVDEDVVDFVDDGVVQLALDAAVERDRHVVAQVVEAELVVRAVGDVGVVGLAAGARLEVLHVLDVVLLLPRVEERLLVLEHAEREAERVEDGAVPLRVALGQVVVDGDEVRALAFERVEVERQGGGERLAFAGLQLGDLALVQDDAADELDVVRALADLAPAPPRGRRRTPPGGGRRRVSPSARRWRNSSVLARSSSSESASKSGSSALMRST